MMVKLYKLVTLTTGVCLGLGCFWNQKAIAATLRSDFKGETIEKIGLIVDNVSITRQPSSSLINYSLGLQLKVSFLDKQASPAERTWFINRNASFNTNDSSNNFLFTLEVDFCESSAPSSVCYSLFDGIRTINNGTPSDREFSRIINDPENPIIKLLTNGDNNNVRLQANLLGMKLVGGFQQSTTEKSAFFVSTPPPEPVIVPEPLTIIGSGTAIGFGTFFKRKLVKNKSVSKKA
ncbi:hypothetical protein CY0110_13281 [Crocosphaera chwakensis CCY0110]|uniref:PEP-CTERM protein-sorting domain-containing protein n=2 Tax=Crocosphaera TaxID=263510 RepID=A3IPK5_9CHRO|nr:hypothetical protein CY0110_13281 [Crocosphaera chwakensis CCY0110]